MKIFLITTNKAISIVYLINCQFIFFELVKMILQEKISKIVKYITTNKIKEQSSKILKSIVHFPLNFEVLFCFGIFHLYNKMTQINFFLKIIDRKKLIFSWNCLKDICHLRPFKAPFMSGSKGTTKSLWCIYGIESIRYIFIK